MAVVRRRFLVSGQVQGVFFRDRCRREAWAAGVRGWVRNLPDGRVEVVAEGPPDALEALYDWCRQGPPHADVRSVEVIDEPAEGLPGFDVR
ncbi:MAG: acylphosphatase [Acidimicrobiales bacterium]